MDAAQFRCAAPNGLKLSLLPDFVQFLADFFQGLQKLFCKCRLFFVRRNVYFALRHRLSLLLTP